MEKPRVLVLSARWAVHASDVRAPGDGRRSNRLLDLDNDRTPIPFVDALVRTIERVHAQAPGTKVVAVGPVPEIDYDPPSTLVRALEGIGPLPEMRRTDFDRRQKQVLSALERVRGMENVLVVYPHAVLCDRVTCAVADGVRSLYDDDDHLGPFGAARVSDQIASAISLASMDLAKAHAAAKSGAHP
jgi:hypothetical protein